MRDEREILTREDVRIKLIRESKRSMVEAVLIAALTLVFFALLFWMLSLTTLPVWAIWVIDGIWACIPLILCTVSFVRSAKRMSKAQRGEFTVSEDTLTDVRDNQLSLSHLIIYGDYHTLLGNKAHLNYVFEFESGKTLTLNVAEYKNTRPGSAASFSMPGDRFYLAFYNDAPQTVIWIYSSKIYNYKA